MRKQSMLFGKQSNRGDVDVIFGGEHEVDEEWYEAYGQDEVCDRSGIICDELGHPLGLFDANRDWFLTSLWRFHHRAGLFCQFVGFRTDATQTVAEFRRVCRQFVQKIKCAIIGE